MSLDFIREKVEQLDAQAFITINHEGSGQPDAAYVAGFTGSESVVLVTKKEQFIFVDGRYFTRVRQESPDFEMIPATRGKVYNDLSTHFKKIGVKRLVIDPNTTFYSSILELKSAVEGVELVEAPAFLHEARAVKSEEEIQKLADSADVACKAFKQLCTELKPGITERHVAARLEYLMKEMGADKYSFNTIVASGVQGAFPHYVPSDKELASGELVTIDWGCYLNGYASDMTRTVAIGEVSDQLKDIYECVKGSQQAGLDAANSSISGKELDMVCRKYIQDRNYGEYFLHGTGHGIGLDVHEYPYVNANNDDLLPINSVVTIEPGIYIEGVGGVRIEDCIVIKNGNGINLNEQVTKDLQILGS